jgi:hypothetical protein
MSITRADLNKPISSNTQTALDAKVAGPASAVNNQIAVFDGTTGKIIKDSGFTIETSVPAGAVFTDTDTDTLAGLTDTTITSPLDNQVLVYDDATGKWVNETKTLITSVTIEGSITDPDPAQWVQATTGDWEDAYIADMTVAGILATDRPIIDLDLSDADFATFEALQDDYALIFRVEVAEAGKIKFYASELPAQDLKINIKAVRE